MKINSSHLFIVAAITFFVISCEKEVKLKEDQINPRIVVNGIFEASDTLRIHLSESRNVLFNNGGDLPNLTSASASLLSENDEVLGTFSHDSFGTYSLIGFYPVAGKEYKLIVNSPGLEEVTSQNLIPEIISIASIDTIRQSENMNFKITINDNPDEVNYYAIIIESRVTEIFPSPIPNVNDTLSYRFRYACSKDVIIEGASEDIDGSKCGQSLLFRDENFNGSSYTVDVESFIGDSPDTVIISLQSISEELFKYNTSLQRYQETNGNPFGEPVQVYSNIENGFGIFAGYSVYADTIVF